MNFASKNLKKSKVQVRILESNEKEEKEKEVKVQPFSTFLTKVFEGPYKNAGKWAKEMKELVKIKRRELKKIYFSYTTCPKYAKACGKNYVVLLAQIN